MTREEIGFVIEMQKKEREKLSKIIDDLRASLREAEAERDLYKSRTEMPEVAMKSYHAQYPRESSATATKFDELTISPKALAKYIAETVRCEECIHLNYCKQILDIAGSFDMSYCEFIHEKWLKQSCG